MRKRPTKRAVCVVVYDRETDRVIGVARRGTKNEWGLPGGSVEHDETFEDAAVREFHEETGAWINGSTLLPLFVRADEDFCVLTFLADLDHDQEISEGDAGPCAWVAWQDLFEGPFADYNRRLCTESWPRFHENSHFRCKELLACFVGSHGYITLRDSERDAARKLVADGLAQWGDYELLERSKSLYITNRGRDKIGMK